MDSRSWARSIRIMTMAYSYKAPQRDQPFLLPPSIGDWLGEDHLVWFVLDVVSLVDRSGFDARHPNDGVGRRAYDPEMMLALLVYAYCTGLRSSRRIEAAVRSDLAFKAICCDLVPDHIAIARFRADHEVAITKLFVDVLALCAQAGLASLGIVAIDGTKIAADAALDVNRGESAIRCEVERIMAEARTSDDAETGQPTLGGDLPEVLAHRSSRLGRLRAALGEIQAQKETRQRHDDEQEARWQHDAAVGRRPRGTTPKDPARALVKAKADLEATRTRDDNARSTLDKLQSKEDLRQAERSVKEAQRAADSAPPAAELQANTTDCESRIMKTASGWVQGYNAQAGVNEHQVIVAAVMTNEANDVAQLLPVISEVESNAKQAGIDGGIGKALADAGYWSEANATAEGPDRMIATTKDWKQRRAARDMGTTTGEPPVGASPIEAMEHRLRTEEGASTYAKRSYTVEPIFGQIKENRSMRRLMRRGITAAQSEWSLMCATSNILKMFTAANGATLAELLAPGT
jgi:transposase